MERIGTVPTRAERTLSSAEDKLRSARWYRRLWAGVTIGAAASTVALYEVGRHFAHYNADAVPLLPWGVPLAVGAVATLGASTQILDGCMLVDSMKNHVRQAEWSVRQEDWCGLPSPETPDVKSRLMSRLLPGE
jgi:hypothetical protein